MSFPSCSHPGPGISAAALRRVCGRYATGITVTTVAAPDGSPFGLTANSFTSVSLEPPLILVCLDHRLHFLPLFLQQPAFGVNILRAEQRDLSVRFSEFAGDRFAGIAWQPGSCGAPLLAGTLGFLECRRHQWVECGDHVILIGLVVASHCEDGQPLLYFDGTYRSLSAPCPGH